MKSLLNVCIAVSLSGMFAFHSSLHAQEAQSANDIISGVWRIVSFQAQSADGAVTNMYGDRPGGLLIYHPTGYMSAQAMRPDLPKCETADRRMCPEKEGRAAFEGYFGYWGRFEVRASEGIVLHMVEGASLPDGIGMTLTRFYEISGNRLVLRTPPQSIRGVQMVVIVTVERVQ
jgi:hypothetical protein